MNEIRMQRRTVLRAGGLLAAAGALGACRSESGGQQNSVTENHAVKLPSYTRFGKVHPDLQGTPDGVLDGFVRFPQPVQGLSGKATSGSPATAMAELAFAPPPPMGRNAYWQELNRRLGVTLNFDVFTEADYPQKLAAVLAGGDIPDIVQLHTDTPRLPDVLRAQFADLTEFLSGDAVNDYPFLANIPSYAWPNVIYNGGIYGVPYSLAPVGQIMMTRQDKLDTLQASTDVSSGAEFLELCKSVTQGRKNVWALSNPPAILLFIREMLGDPAAWTVHNGTFKSGYETDTYRRALSIVDDWRKAGVFHPDAFNFSGTAGGQKQEDLFGSGQVLLDFRQYTWWTNYYTRGTDPDLRIGSVLPVDYEGHGMGRKALTSGVYTITGLRKASKSRIKELLQILNYTAAPFGTEEYVFNLYGSAARDHTEVKGAPVLTAKGKTEVTLPLSYVAARPPVIFVPGFPQVTRDQYEYQKKVVPSGVVDASKGLTSDTYAKKNAELEAGISDTALQVMQGRKSLSDWDGAVASWRSNGGDQIRSEYEKAYAELKPR